MMIKYIALLLFFIYSFEGNCQNDLKYAPNTYCVKGNNNFIISTKPITNREYILFLLWNYSVYFDFLENLVTYFPALKTQEIKISDIENSSENAFHYLISHSAPHVENYIFNPKYIDYPVIGITWYQASQFCKWLSDRYNEYKLNELKYIKINPIPNGDNSFVTEAYLANQYDDLTGNNTIVKWQDNILVPAFRLPTKQELIDAKIVVNDINIFKPYPFDTSSFLKHWNELHLFTNDSLLLLKNIMGYKEYFNNIKKWNFKDYQYKELTLDYNIVTKKLSLIDIYSKLGQ